MRTVCGLFSRRWSRHIVQRSTAVCVCYVCVCVYEQDHTAVAFTWVLFQLQCHCIDATIRTYIIIIGDYWTILLVSAAVLSHQNTHHRKRNIVYLYYCNLLKWILVAYECGFSICIFYIYSIIIALCLLFKTWESIFIDKMSSFFCASLNQTKHIKTYAHLRENIDQIDLSVLWFSGWTRNRSNHSTNNLAQITSTLGKM